MRREHGDPWRRRATGRVYYLLPLSWLILSLVAVTAFVGYRYQRVETAFREDAASVAGYFMERQQGNAAMLRGFSALLGAMDRMDRVQVARYARQVRAMYPHIHRLEVVEEISRDRLVEFETTQGHALGGEFKVWSFGRDENRGDPGIPGKPRYYPVVFTEPMADGAARVLGLDIESEPPRRQVMLESRAVGRCAVSRPFRLAEGGLAYLMLRPANPAASRFALLVIRSTALSPPDWIRRRNDMNLTLQHADYRLGDPDGVLSGQVAEPAGWLESRLLPRLRWRQDMAGEGSPFLLLVEKQVRWRDVELPTLLAAAIAQFAVLFVLVGYARHHHAIERARRRHERHLAYQASHDSLTGLPNRSLLMDRLEQSLLRAGRQDSILALLFLDVDNFKRVNDSHGHDAGDRLLMIIADHIRQALRAQDTVARLSGDEFVVVLEQVASRAEAATVAGKIADAIPSVVSRGYQDLGVGLSVGIAMFPEDATDAYSLLRHADTHMYSMKRGETLPLGID